MDQTIRYGVLGCGYFGAEFARAIDEMDGCKLAAVYSPGESAARLSLELGCPAVSEMESMFRDSTIDAVIVATPNDLHHDHVLMAARAGKHVFCEKPFALHTEDAKEMIEVCEAAGVTLMVGHIMHFYSGIAAVKSMIDAGSFGHIMTIHIERTGWEQRQEQVSWKKMQSRSGGHLFHHIHELDILQWILGLPSELYAAGGNLGHSGDGFGDEDDVLLLTARFDSGAFATMQYGSGFRIGNHLIRINGSKMGAVIDFKQSEVRLVDDVGTRVISLFEDEQSDRAMKELFARTDGGISYGKPDERPPQYILASLRREMQLFCDVLRGTSIPEDKKDLFDGTSAYNSVCIAQNGLLARNQGVSVKLEIS